MAQKRLLPTIFVHFYSPEGDPVFADEHLPLAERRLPTGVKIYGPGSKENKEAQASVTQGNLDRKAKKVTAHLLEQNALDLLTKCTFEVVNFESIEGYEKIEAAGVRAFYEDPGYVHFRDQVQEKMGDFSASAAKVSTS